jgi:hypothetical protein
LLQKYNLVSFKLHVTTGSCLDGRGWLIIQLVLFTEVPVGGQKAGGY